MEALFSEKNKVSEMRGKFMSKHQLKIIVSEGNGDVEPVNIDEFKTMPLFKRLSSKWIGKVMAIVPDKAVQLVQINEGEVEENGKLKNARKSKTV